LDMAELKGNPARERFIWRGNIEGIVDGKKKRSQAGRGEKGAKVKRGASVKEEGLVGTNR